MSSKENTDLNGDGTAGQAGGSAAANAVPQEKSIYHEVADLTAADFKALGRGFQVLQLVLLCSAQSSCCFYSHCNASSCQVVSCCAYCDEHGFVDTRVECDGIDSLCRAS